MYLPVMRVWTERVWISTYRPLVVLAVFSLAANFQSKCQVTISKKAIIKGTSTASSALRTQNTYVYVVFPPAVNPSGGKNNDNFRTEVMDKIDGVTVQIRWADIEQVDAGWQTGTGYPGSTSCGTIGDQCQLDSSGIYHKYNWGTADGTFCATGSSAGLGQWFCNTGALGWTGAKKVNPLIFGISDNLNTATPDYIFTSTWQSIVGASTPQDVINFLKDSCGSYKGYTTSGSTSPTNPNVTGLGMIKVGGTTTVTVTMSSTPPFAVGDTVWVDNVVSSSPYNNAPGGATVQTVGSNQFTYTVTCPINCSSTITNPSSGNFINQQASWPIPTEAPYKVAWRSFVSAAIAHFSPSHSGSVVVPSQVAYLRAGYARGGESQPECQANWPSSIDSSKEGWLRFYADTSAYLMGAVGKVAPVPWHMQTALNAAGPPGMLDSSYGTAEAQISVQFIGGDGRVLGFGSQGLQSTDIGNCSGSSSDWCNQFNQFWLGGRSYQNTEFELQQIDCSDPSTPAQTALPCALNFNGTTGTSRTGDLRALLPCATDNHMTILELYNQDALLAYDPNYCDIDTSGSSCKTSTTVGDIFPGKLTAAQQYTFFQAAGQPACSTPSNAACGVASPVGCYQSVIDSTSEVH